MRLYFDYNASAPIRAEVRAAIEPLLFGGAGGIGGFGNASSIHWAGREAKKHLEAARASIAARLKRSPGEVVFTSGGSESDNLALQGVLLAPKRRVTRLVTSAVEHPAVRETACDLAKNRGVELVEIPVDAEGRLDVERLERELAGGAPALVSIMAVNNETGVIVCTSEIVDLAHRHGALVHVDAVQAAGRVPLLLDADLITLSAHKLGAPKGSGALITRAGIPLAPSILGGPQERGRRAGTEPVALHVGLATALAIALDRQKDEEHRLGELRARLERALEQIDGVRVLGGGAPRVANTTTALFAGIEGESLLQALDLAGVAASSGSACASGSLEASHVLLAMGIPKERALSAVRFSTGWGTRPEEMASLIELLPAVVAAVRRATRV